MAGPRQRHHAAVRRELKRFGGKELDTAGDGFFASFDRPAEAIRCACAISDEVRELGLEIRAGLHTRGGRGPREHRRDRRERSGSGGSTR